MKVYLVPVGPVRYRMYVEMPPEVVAPDADGSQRGWFGRQVQRFRATLAEAEAERLRNERGEASQATGPGRTIMRKIAEAIAEQRLLWHLRHQTTVQLCHPLDLEGGAALSEVRAEFSRDVAKHVRWLIIDGLLVAITGPVFFFVPGPNVISWYFTFRAAGHFLSWRGARKGMTKIDWRAEPSAPLAHVRQAIALPPHARRHRLEEISVALGLKHFTGFVERVASRAS